MTAGFENNLFLIGTNSTEQLILFRGIVLFLVKTSPTTCTSQCLLPKNNLKLVLHFNRLHTQGKKSSFVSPKNMACFQIISQYFKHDNHDIITSVNMSGK